MMNTASNEPPGKGRRFYTIQERADGLVDIYLDPHVYPLSTEDGATDYDITVRLVRGVDPSAFNDLETNIREHFKDWCECGEMIYL